MKTIQEKTQELIDCMNNNNVVINFNPKGMLTECSVSVDGIKVFDEIFTEKLEGIDIESSKTFQDLCNNPKTDREMFNKYKLLLSNMRIVSSSVLEQVYVDFENNAFWKIAYQDLGYNTGVIFRNDKSIFEFDFS